MKYDRYIPCYCDSCGAKREVPMVSSTQVQLPKSWGLYTVDNRSITLCRRCNENYKRFGRIGVNFDERGAYRSGKERVDRDVQDV